MPQAEATMTLPWTSAELKAIFMVWLDAEPIMQRAVYESLSHPGKVLVELAWASGVVHGIDEAEEVIRIIPTWRIGHPN